MSDEICVGSGFNTFEEQDKILVGLSGGVDSSVCIRILREQGFNVQACVIRFSPAHDKAVAAAIKIADQLDVPLTIEDCTQQFEQSVIEPFCNDYCNGVTPSPCILCNPLVKFRTLANVADRFGIRYIASGHYARVGEENGIFHIEKAVSSARDQSYMLYRLPQDILSRLCLPVGEFEKDDIRAMAEEANLASANAPDSQEICFIPDGDYAAYIANRGLTCAKGNFIGPRGENLGQHKGVIHYTVGQRKGLNIAYGEPIFIKRILENGDILLAISGDEFYNGVKINNLVRSDGKAYEIGETFDVKVRSRAVPAPCTITKSGEGEIEITFSQPQRAPAPGQSAVFYNHNLVIGGGIITEMLQ